ncbi:MAG: permease-like cell division protein FtsX [Coriobacteriia bacterium]|nr:permease-like cell division protein FtsX [Coriobacteriia bacterium]
MRSLAYFIKEAFSNSRKNFSTTFGGIITIFLSLLVIGVFMVASLIIDQMIKSVESQVSISIYLHDDVTDMDLESFKGFLSNMPEVSTVVYISKEQSLERFKEQATTDIADQLDGNPLPALLEVSLREPDKVQSVVDQIMANDLFLSVIDRPDAPQDSIKYGKDIIEKLFSITSTIRIVCIALVILLVFVALIFINNTIRLAILARRKEIAIMKLVGASNGFIRGPFLMEGFLQAVIGAGLSIGTISMLCNYLIKNVQTILPWLPINMGQLSLWMIYLVLLGAGVVIGLFGSLWAMRRYLKV